MVFYKTTGMNVFNAAEGPHLSYTYTVVNEIGEVVDSNLRQDIVIVDSELSEAYNNLLQVLEKLAEKDYMKKQEEVEEE